MIRVGAFLVVAAVMVCTVQTVEAQILRRLRERVEDRVEQRVEEEVNREADRLVDSAADALLEGMASAFTGGNNMPTVETVEFRTLQNMLPARSLGVDRTSLSGESSQALGMAMSHAKAEYSQGDRYIDITITDMGTLQGLAVMGNTWLLNDVEHETDDGFMHSMEYEGHPAMQAAELSENSASMTVIVGDRFSVVVEGQGYSVVEVEEAMNDVPIEALHALRHYGMSPEDVEKIEQSTNEYREAMAEWRAEIEENETDAAAVDFRELRALLPESPLGYMRTRADGSRTSMMGFSVSVAEGAYEGPDGQHARVHLLDMGGAYNTLGLGMMWVATDIDRETETGYERTVEFQGFPAYEEVDLQNTRSTLNFVAWYRYLVSVEGEGLTIEDVHSIANSINVNALAQL